MAKQSYDQKNAVDGWGTSTQLTYGPPVPYRFRITGAEFNKDMRRKGSEDVLFLCLHGEALDVDNLAPIEKFENHTIELKCGPDWETHDNGKTAEHPSGRNVFDGRTRAGMFVDKIVADPALKTWFKDIAAAGIPSTNSAAFVGYDITIGEMKKKGSGDIPDYGVVIPIEYHGRFDVEEASERQAKADDELNSQLVKLAKESDSHETFQNEAMGLGISDAKLLDSIMDDGDEGFWARNQK